jgi:hypothetical protein
MPNPFRFTAQVPDLAGTPDEWRAELTRIEDAGSSTVALADHFTGGYTLDPIVVLAQVAAHRRATSSMSARWALGTDAFELQRTPILHGGEQLVVRRVERERWREGDRVSVPEILDPRTDDADASDDVDAARLEHTNQRLCVDKAW